MLSTALKETGVAIGIEAADWREAVEASGRLLMASDAAEKRYVDAMVTTVEELGAYAVIAPGVAIPHARPEDGALRLGLSLAVLARPVEFGSRENDPVDLVFGFATPDGNAHVELLQALADFLEAQQNLTALREAGSVTEVLEIVAKGDRRDD